MQIPWRASIVAGLAACGSLAASAADAEPLTTVRVASGLSRPTFVTHAPGDFSRVFITEQTGRIRILDLQSGTVLPDPFLDLTSTITCCGERGLLRDLQQRGGRLRAGSLPCLG
jgi:hypothetical protein